MAQFTLDDIRTAAEAKYGSTDIEVSEGRVCRLLNPLKLSKETRTKLGDLQKELDREAEEGEEQPDQEDILRDCIRLVAENETLANELLDALGDDLTMLATIFETYGKATQVGEA